MPAQVAKLILVDNKNNYLLPYRSNHPTFGNDPDLPCGTLEENETPIETMIREVYEETSIHVAPDNIQELYNGKEYSLHNTHYWLFQANITNRPEVLISWEHERYEWLSQAKCLKKAKAANDTFMHMVYDVVNKNTKH